MTLDLSSTYAKLNRAKEHLRIVKDEVAPWMQGQPYKAIPQINADCTRYSIFTKQMAPSPPLQRWTLIFGDCIHNLRAALDHLIYAIAIHESRKNPPPREGSLQFPICNTPDEFRTGRNGEKRIETLSPEIRRRVEFMQPYNRRHTAVPPPLAILRDLVNTDKHKLLKLAYAAITQGQFSLLRDGDDPGATPIEVIGYYGEINDGTEVAAVVFDRPNPGFQFQAIVFEVVIAVWHGKRDETAPEWTERTDFSTLLDLLVGEVEYVIKQVSSSAK